MSNQLPKLQCAITLLVFHDSKEGHRVTFTKQIAGREPERCGDYIWKGCGIPDEVLNGILNWQYALTQEHLVYRYGMADKLDLPWAGDPGPY